MSKKPTLFFEVDKRVTTEYQCSINTKIYGTVRGSAELTTGPGSVDNIAEIMKNFPRCIEFNVSAGEDIKVILNETTTTKEYPSMGTYSKDRLQDTVDLFGIFDLRENSPY